MLRSAAGGWNRDKLLPAVLSILGQRLGIAGIGLGQGAEGADKSLYLQGVHPMAGNAGGHQLDQQDMLMTTGRLADGKVDPPDAFEKAADGDGGIVDDAGLRRRP